jgi:hypothetical protein
MGVSSHFVYRVLARTVPSAQMTYIVEIPRNLGRVLSHITFFNQSVTHTIQTLNSPVFLMVPDMTGSENTESNPFLRYMLISLCENFFSSISKQ